MKKRYIFLSVFLFILGIFFYQLTGGTAKDVPNFNSAYDESFNPQEFIKSARSGDLNKVKFHIEKNIDPNVTDSDGRTALLGAVIEKQYEVVDYLLLSKADPNKKDYYEQSPLKTAMEINDKKLIEMLQSNGAIE
ncbi:ankyrin repeat domain-containing protein [Brevibacillus brevis]|uniref:ankyrin repeat domain-containing protein n=1 Tax=Brevibacillus brevis TaxID=1393 RepID=UPI001C8DE07A|nr:ankyrin repeat domain-containing protein [Brevibacillus brevis]MBY0085759.1 ankyrin repeat domain-containing protein [Brevibacillus brevis]